MTSTSRTRASRSGPRHAGSGRRSSPPRFEELCLPPPDRLPGGLLLAGRHGDRSLAGQHAQHDPGSWPPHRTPVAVPWPRPPAPRTPITPPQPTRQKTDAGHAHPRPQAPEAIRFNNDFQHLPPPRTDNQSRFVAAVPLPRRTSSSLAAWSKPRPSLRPSPGRAAAPGAPAPASRRRPCRGWRAGPDGAGAARAA